MIRFALIPFAFFATACADADDLTQAADDLETEFRELVEEHEVDAERSAIGPKPLRVGNQTPHAIKTVEKPRPATLGQRVVEVAADRFERNVNKEGCKMVGAAFGAWKDQRLEYRGQMFHASGKPMDRIRGKVVVTSNGAGELYGYSVNPEGDISTVAVEGDWMGKHLDADVTVRKGSQNHEMMLIGGIEGAFDGRGHFIGALAVCK